MDTETTNPRTEHFNLTARLTVICCSILAILLGAVACAGFVLGIVALRSLHLGDLHMKANTATSILLGGISLWFMRDPGCKSPQKNLAYLLAGIVAVVGLLTFIEHLSGLNFGIDQLLAKEPPGEPGTVSPGRMGPIASIGFSLCGLALLLLNTSWSKGRSMSQYLAMATLMMLLFPLIGYAYGAHSLNHISKSTAIAAPTVFAIMAIATGILFARPNIGLMSVFLRDDAGAMMARRMVVPAIVVPFLLGLLRFNLEKLGWISTDTGRSLLIILLIVSGTSLIWWNAFFLSKATEQRTQAVLDRDLASKSLAASESRYKDLVHGLPAAIYTCDNLGQIILFNKAAVALWSREPEAGKSRWCGAYRMYRPDGTEMPIDEYPTAVSVRNGKAVRDVELIIEQIDGSRRSVIAHPELVYDASGVVIGVVNMLRDITETKRHAALVIAQNRAFEQALNQLPLSTVLETLVLAAEAQCANRTIASISLLEDGQRLRNGAAPNLPREYRDAIDGIKIGPNSGSCGTAAHTASSVVVNDIATDPHWEDYKEIAAKFGLRACWSYPIFSANKKVLATFALYSTKPVDPTPRELEVINLLARTAGVIIESKLSEESRQQLARIVESSHDAIIGKSLDGKVTSWNSGATKLLGYTADEIVGREHAVLVAPDKIDEFPTRVQGLVEGKPTQYETVRVAKDGRRVDVSVMLSPVMNSLGLIVGASAILRDISRIRRAEIALRKSESALRDLNASLEHKIERRTAESESRMRQLRGLALDLAESESRERKRLAQLLHDHFQQLISAAKLKTGIVRRRETSAASVEALKQVESLLEEVLNSSRSLATELSPPILNDAGLIPALAWLARSFEQKFGLQVRIDCDEATEPPNEQLRTMLFEFTRELLFNVVKHANSKEASVLGSVSADGVMRLTVADKGAGFDQRQARSEKKNTESSFGLFSIQERVGFIGGLVEIRSAVGQGTEVTISVPYGVSKSRLELQPSKLEVATPSRTSEAKVSTTSITVVVADDHTLFREGLLYLLAQEPAFLVVSEAADGLEALEAVRRLRPDILICDVNMPKMNGVQVTSVVTQELPHTRVVGLSMHDEQDMAMAMRSAGAAAYLSKGGASDTLLEVLRSVAAR